MLLTASAGRVYAMVLRYSYLLRGSWPRLLELAYWPTVQMILWGLINQFMVAQSAWVAQAAGLFIAAVLLWDVLFRAQLGVSVVFFEEMYSRNLGHLFTSPLRPSELVLALLGISLLRTLIGVGLAALLAMALYRYSIFSLGLPLLAFFTNLLVLISWLFFRAKDFSQAWYFLSRILHWQSDALAWRLVPITATFLVVLIIYDVLEYATRDHTFLLRMRSMSAVAGVATALMLTVFLYMATSKPLPFVYFQF